MIDFQKMTWIKSKMILVVDKDLIVVIEAPTRDYKSKLMDVGNTERGVNQYFFSIVNFTS